MTLEGGSGSPGGQLARFHVHQGMYKLGHSGTPLRCPTSIDQTFASVHRAAKLSRIAGLVFGVTLKGIGY